MRTHTFFATPARALWSRHASSNEGVEARQSRRASAAVRNTSTSEPTFVTPSFQVNEGSTLAVCTSADSSGPALHGGFGAGGSSFHPAARSLRRSTISLARFVSAAV